MTRLEEIKKHWEENYGSSIANGDIDLLFTSLSEMEESKLFFMKECERLEGVVEKLEERVKKHIDTETSLIGRWEQAESKLTKLCGAVDRHRGFTCALGGHMSPEEEVADEELYRTRDEVGKEKT